MNATPPICYDDCDDAYRIAQSYGKTSDLCWEGRSFKVLYQQCLACIADNTNRSKGTVRDYIQPELEDFINYCEKREVTALTTVYSTRVTTVTGSQGPVTSTVVMGEVIRMGGETSSFADTSIKPHIAIIVGSVIPLVLLISVLGFLSFHWLRRRRAAKEQGGPASDERGWNDDKPQLHSECVERPTFELEDSVPVVVVIAAAKERLEMAVNEPAAYEMPVGKGCPRKL
ncbi:hypothetical protein BKA59DRAFT_405263 [Fusarium tricinctum]|uniref:Uncharacterized protein n=1 Tax=Fusarium tricinctum TaxID=61284 RepID=A0A8K0RJK1_9HYPO|nr:hypothetical protein BKA59DRAFT_405263 [Fusarium tricinctum]